MGMVHMSPIIRNNTARTENLQILMFQTQELEKNNQIKKKYFLRLHEIV